MSLSTIESDYTPKDFLEKLLGNKFKSQKSSEVVPEHNQINGNSQSQSLHFSHNQTNPKTANVKRIHFQSVQNIRSPRKTLTEIQLDQQKNVQCSKQNQSKETLKKQRSPLNFQRSIFNQKVIDAPETNDFQKTIQKQVVKKTAQKDIPSTKNQEQQNLIIQKAFLLLKVTLKGKLSNEDIQNVIDKIQRGMRNSSQFDSIILQSQQNASCQKKKEEPKKEIQQKMRAFRSKSIQAKKSAQDLSIIRCHSQKKKALQTKTKKERKNEMLSTKKEILSTIKKMKQLFYLNEKSLKMTKRTTLF